jgi:hypothetical protein
MGSVPRIAAAVTTLIWGSAHDGLATVRVSEGFGGATVAGGGTVGLAGATVAGAGATGSPGVIAPAEPTATSAARMVEVSARMRRIHSISTESRAT